MATYKELLVLLDKGNEDGVWEAIRLAHTHNNLVSLERLEITQEGAIVIDGNVLDTHTHDNKELLSKLSVNDEGKLMFNGSPVSDSNGNLSVSWGEILNRPDKIVVSVQGSDDSIKVIYDDLSEDEFTFNTGSSVTGLMSLKTREW